MEELQETYHTKEVLEELAAVECLRLALNRIVDGSLHPDFRQLDDGQLALGEQPNPTGQDNQGAACIQSHVPFSSGELACTTKILNPPLAMWKNHAGAVWPMWEKPGWRPSFCVVFSPSRKTTGNAVAWYQTGFSHASTLWMWHCGVSWSNSTVCKRSFCCHCMLSSHGSMYIQPLSPSVRAEGLQKGYGCAMPGRGVWRMWIWIAILPPVFPLPWTASFAVLDRLSICF